MKSGTLKFPEDKDIPVLMVGPGTGVAPFRSALQERIAEGKHSMTFFVLWLYTKIYVLCTLVYCGGFFPHLGNVLFFGCRSESKDFYFHSEWEKAKQMEHLTLFTAFSQDQVRKHVISVWNRNVFFICPIVYMLFNHRKFD